MPLSPDGRFLYLQDWSAATPRTEVFDIESSQFTAYRAKAYAAPAFLMNAKFLPVSTYSTGEYSHHMSVLGPDNLTVLSS